MKEAEIKVTDKHGFVYRVDLKLWPETGVAIAYYKGDKIASVEHGKAGYPPMSDSDAAWERWDQTCEEWCDGCAADLLPMCQVHFNLSHKRPA